MSLNIHNALLNLGISLGYLPKDSGGSCHGITLAWISAWMVNEEQRYTQRVNRVVKENNLIEKLELLKGTLKRKKAYTEVKVEAELDLLEILSFYETVVLYQQPCKYSGLFNTRFHQTDIVPISEIASSKKLAALGGLKTIYSQSSIYSQEELADYLDSVASSINQTQSRIGFVLSNHNHTLGLAYDTRLGAWTFMDINQWPPKKFNQRETRKLAKNIISGFQDQLNSGYMAMDLNIITTGDEQNKTVLRSKITALENRTDIKRLCERSDSTSLAYIAARNGHTSLLEVLAQNGANLDIPNNKGATPTWIAAQNGDANAISVLAQYKADLDIPNNKGATPTWIAAQNGDANAISVLAQYKADLDIPNNEGAKKWTPSVRQRSLTI